MRPWGNRVASSPSIPDASECQNVAESHRAPMTTKGRWRMQNRKAGRLDDSGPFRQEPTPGLKRREPELVESSSPVTRGQRSYTLEGRSPGLRLQASKRQHRLALPRDELQWLLSRLADHSGGTAPDSHRTSLLGPNGRLRGTWRLAHNAVAVKQQCDKSFPQQPAGRSKNRRTRAGGGRR